MDKEPELSPVEMLFSAAESGNLNKLSCLLDQGVDVNSCSKYGTTLLQSAVLEDHGDLVQFLIGRGAQVDLPVSFPRKFVFQEMGYNAPANWKEKRS